jgi:hypothetical protein
MGLCGFVPQFGYVVKLVSFLVMDFCVRNASFKFKTMSFFYLINNVILCYFKCLFPKKIGKKKKVKWEFKQCILH